MQQHVPPGGRTVKAFLQSLKFTKCLGPTTLLAPEAVSSRADHTSTPSILCWRTSRGSWRFHAEFYYHFYNNCCNVIMIFYNVPGRSTKVHDDFILIFIMISITIFTMISITIFYNDCYNDFSWRAWRINCAASPPRTHGKFRVRSTSLIQKILESLFTSDAKHDPSKTHNHNF